jgi:hypothetical protein
VAGGDRARADLALIVALASGATVQEASTSTRVSARTIQRRLQDADFQTRLAQARDQMLDRALGVLTAASTEAAEVLRTLARTADSESVRRAAARDILLLGAVDLRQAGELADRVRALEEALSARPELRRVR